MTLRLLACLAVALTLAGCRGSPERRELDRQRAEQDDRLAEAADAHNRLAAQEVDAAERGDAGAIRALWFAEQPWATEWVELHAESRAAVGRAWPELVRLAGSPEAAFTFLVRQGADDAGSPQAPPYESPFAQMRAALDDAPGDAPAGPVIFTPNGPLLDATLPAPDGTSDTRDEIEARLNYLAFGLGEDTPNLLYFGWLNDQIAAGATSLEEVAFDRFRTELPEASVQAVTDRVVSVLEGMQSEADAAGLTRLSNDLATSITESRQAAQRIREGAAE